MVSPRVLYLVNFPIWLIICEVEDEHEEGLDGIPIFAKLRTLWDDDVGEYIIDKLRGLTHPTV